MKKTIFLSIFACLFMTTISQAQSGFSIGIHAGIPTGDASENQIFNLGFDAAYLFDISEDFKVGPTLSYTIFFAEPLTEIISGATGTTVTATPEDINYFIPAATLRYSFSESFFGAADLGYAISATDNIDGGFYYQPKAGWQTKKIDLFAYYKGIAVNDSSLSAIGIGFAYKF